MRELAIGLLAAAGVALTVPANAQTIYETVPPAAGALVAPGYGAYAYVVPQAPTNVYSYQNGDYGYTKYTYANGCHVTTIRDYGQITVDRNCY